MQLYSPFFIWLVAAWSGQALSAAPSSWPDQFHGPSGPWPTNGPYAGQHCNPNNAAVSVQPPNGQWLGWGADTSNNRWASAGASTDSSNAASLVETCSKQYLHGVSATAVVQGGVAYYPTWSGLFVALNYKTCTTLWEFNVTSLVLNFGPVISPLAFAGSRTSAALDGSVLYFGTQAHGLLVAVDRNSGSLIDYIQINQHPYSVITQSPTVWQGTVFVGSSSVEESAAAFVPGYKCCSFVANFNAITLNQSTRKLGIKWSQAMLPANSGFTGAAVWGGQPSIDPARQQVFIGTGNVYTVPADVQACQDQTQNITFIQQGLGRDPCVPRDAYQESILAFDLNTGLVNWVNQLGALDAWTVACIPQVNINPGSCPPNPGPDADFGMAPTFIPGSASTPYGKDVVVFGQKNGNLYAISAQAGTVFWAVPTSPSGYEGGLIWGVAVDASAVYFTAANSLGIPWKPVGSANTISNSAFGAVSLVNGKVLWETQSPMNDSTSFATPSVVNDVVLTGRTQLGNLVTRAYGPGGLVALNKITGAVLRDYQLNTSFYGNIAIVDNYVLFGTGYNNATGYGGFHVWQS